jgi:deoxyribodipyrimidine photo-lyase
VPDVGYWIVFELLWRDFFKFIAMKYGTRLFYGRGLKPDPYVWKHDLKQFEAWRSMYFWLKTVKVVAEWIGC